VVTPFAMTWSFRRPVGRPGSSPDRPRRTAWRCELLMCYQLKVTPSATGTMSELRLGVKIRT
jgi:hypothetical protein